MSGYISEEKALKINPQQGLRKCITPRCKNTFRRPPEGEGSQQKRCPECVAETGREKQLDYYHRQAALAFDSPNPISEKEALEILTNVRGLSTLSVVDWVYKAAVVVARRKKLVTNHFFWTNGVIQTLASIEADTPQPLTVEGDDIISGEIIYRKEVYAIWDVTKGLEGESFENFLAVRRTTKTDTMAREQLLGKDMHDQPHRRWAEMFVQWNPDGLKPGYNQEDMKAWLNAQSEIKKRLLIACRNSYKSNFTLGWLVGAVLCCPDIRLLLVSETRLLSESFIGGFRSFFEVKDINNLTEFQKYHLEGCIEVGEGSADSFVSPLARLDLFQPTAESTSMDSQGAAGRRADVIVFDDPISNMTVGTEVQRAKSVTKYDALLELLEVGGYVLMCCTPWHEDDLSATILERNEKAKEKQWAYRIDPAWVVKPEARSKSLFDLEESDIESYLFPARLGWKVLRAKLSDSDTDLRTFRMQTLCEFLPEVDESLRLHFNRDDLVRNRIEQAEVPIGGDLYASCDMAFSKSRQADLTCFTIFKILADKLYVLWQESGHWRDSEKAPIMIRLAKQYPNINRWLIEKYQGSEGLDEAIRREAMMHSVSVPLFWAQPNNVKDAKWRRLKNIELDIAANKIKFVSGPWCDDLFNELEKLDGTTAKRRSSTIKDDRGDSLALGIKYFMPDPDDQDAEARKKLEEEERLQRDKEEYKNWIFNGVTANPQTGRSWHYGGSLPAQVEQVWTPKWPTSKPTVRISFGNLPKN